MVGTGTGGYGIEDIGGDGSGGNGDGGNGDGGDGTSSGGSGTLLGGSGGQPGTGNEWQQGPINPMDLQGALDIFMKRSNMYDGGQVKNPLEELLKIVGGGQ